MLKLRIFIWRYKISRSQNLSIIDSALMAKNESTILTPHFQELKQEQIQKEEQKFWKKVDIKNEAKQSLNQLQSFASNIQTPKFEKQKLFEVLKLYNLSIQALLEGKREVIQNDNFVFKDGQSLQQKVDNIKNILQRITNQ